MVKHIVEIDKCKGCGKCIEACGLELWELADKEDGKKIAGATIDAAVICHMCLCCRDACPENALTIVDE